MAARERAERFYGGVLGLPVCARLDEGGLKMAFFTLVNHHDFAVMEVPGDGSSRSEPAVGLPPSTRVHRGMDSGRLLSLR